MKKGIFFLLVLLVSRIGFAYADPNSNTVLNIQSFLEVPGFQISISIKFLRF